jgi:hypothetical protein
MSVLQSPVVPETPTEAVICDRCGARAAVLVALPKGGNLTFCNHHYNQHKTMLTKIGAIVYDRKED